jgi:hypothetical protein
LNNIVILHILQGQRYHPAINLQVAFFKPTTVYTKTHTKNNTKTNMQNKEFITDMVSKILMISKRCVPPGTERIKG